MSLPTPEEVARRVWSASTREQAADDIRADRLRVFDYVIERRGGLDTRCRCKNCVDLRDMRREIEQP